jgi:hypothetical protein
MFGNMESLIMEIYAVVLSAGNAAMDYALLIIMLLAVGEKSVVLEPARLMDVLVTVDVGE